MKDHIHKYLRVIQNKDTGYTIYKCVIPGCKHYIRKELLIGREAICWRCGTVMVIGVVDITMKKMRHHECRRQPRSKGDGVANSATSEQRVA